MSTREFLPYKESLSLKELGYIDIWRHNYWLLSPLTKMKPIQTQLDYDILYGDKYYNSYSERFPKDILIPSPTFSQAFKWFRETHDLDCSIQKEKIKIENKWVKTKYYSYSIEDNNDLPLSLGFELKDNSTYEEAELSCLQKLIQIVKERKKK